MITPFFIYPKELMQNDDLKALEKDLLIIIANMIKGFKSLNKDNNFTFASNGYYAKMVNRSKKSVSSAINKLIKNEWLIVEYFDKKRLLKLSKKTEDLFNFKYIKENSKEPYYKKGKEIPQDIKVDWLDDYIESIEKG